MGIDTVKLSYQFEPVRHSFDDRPWASTRNGRRSPWLHFSRGGWCETMNGKTGPVWWRRMDHVSDVAVTIKGCGSDVRVLWEGSVPKFLHHEGAIQAWAVEDVDRELRGLIPRLGRPDVRRVDLTEDLFDPMGVYRAAAIGWSPHPRSRYVQGRYQDDETVWLHNKSRGVRVYDKFAECEEPWAEGITRVEYQTRGDWCKKLGLDRLYEDFARNADRSLSELVADLEHRVKSEGRQGCGPDGPGA